MARTATILTLILLATAAGCSDSGTGPVDPSVLTPGNLRAYALDEAVGLLWRTSSSEDQRNFGGYRLTIRTSADGATVRTVTYPKGTTSAVVDSLGNGVRYLFTLHAVTTAGKRSTDSAMVEWSPAARVTLDENGGPIRVYATTSLFPSGVDLYADSARAEELDLLSPAFAARGDFFVFTPNMGATLQLVSPSFAAMNPGQLTEFADVPPAEADDFDDAAATSVPVSSSYYLTAVTLDAGYVDKGRVYFGRAHRGGDVYYFRVLVRRSTDGSLIRGTGLDRYIEIAASWQTGRNVPFSKR